MKFQKGNQAHKHRYSVYAYNWVNGEHKDIIKYNTLSKFVAIQYAKAVKNVRQVVIVYSGKLENSHYSWRIYTRNKLEPKMNKG